MGNQPSSTSFFAFSKTPYARFHLNDLYTDQVRENTISGLPKVPTTLRKDEATPTGRKWCITANLQSLSIHNSHASPFTLDKQQIPRPSRSDIRQSCFLPKASLEGGIVENYKLSNCLANAQRVNRVYSQSDTLWNFHVAWQGITSNMSIII